MTSVTRKNLLLAPLLACVVGGCATSPKAEMPLGVPASPVLAAPAPEPEQPPQTLEEAEARLERARAELEELAVAPGSRSAAGAAAPAPPAAESRAEAAAEPAPKAEAECQSACRAFSSLGRASDAVCRLDTQGGKRCERARQIRDDASRRVAACGCVQ